MLDFWKHSFELLTSLERFSVSAGSDLLLYNATFYLFPHGLVIPAIRTLAVDTMLYTIPWSCYPAGFPMYM